MKSNTSSSDISRISRTTSASANCTTSSAPEIGFKRLDATVDSVTRLELKGLVSVKWNEKTQNSNPHVRTSIVSITDKGREVLDAEDKRNGCNIPQYAKW